MRALAISADGATAVSGSFDSSAIVWSLTRNAAEQVLRFHESAVNAVALAPDGRIVTGGEDGRVALWRPGSADARGRVRRPHRADRRARGVAGRHDARLGVLGPHGAAVAARGRRAARARRPSAERQRRGVRAGRQDAGERGLRPDAADLAARRRGRPDGRRCRRRSIRSRSRATARSSPAAPTAGCSSCRPTASCAARSTAGADADHRASRCRPTARWSRPPASAARSRSSSAATRTLARTLVGPGPAGVVGGVLPRQPHAADRRHRPHDPPLERRNRRSYRPGGDGRHRRSACGLCRRPRRRGVPRLHRLPHADARRRQPRRPDACTAFSAAGSRPLPGYNFSPALKQLDIVWTPETVSKLFEIGPMAYTPGTKMPEQKHRLGRGPRGAGAISAEGHRTALSQSAFGLTPPVLRAHNAPSSKVAQTPFANQTRDPLGHAVSDARGVRPPPRRSADARPAPTKHDRWPFKMSNQSARRP